MIGDVYLIHFERPISPLHTCQHYCGYADDWRARLADHRAGHGARLTQVAVERGIAFDVVAVWPGDRTYERTLKNLKALNRLCPICGRRHPGGRLHAPALPWAQLELPWAEFDPFTRATARVDWYEISQERRWRAHSFTGDRALGEVLAADLGIPW
jgi:hypothetical protein